MATETAAHQGFHDDFDLDIDLALGDDGNAVSVAQHSSVNVTVPLSTKDAGAGLASEVLALANTERAPSEINYDSEPEVDPVDKTSTDHAEDEITWDDADEETDLVPQTLSLQTEIDNPDLALDPLPKDPGQDVIENLDEATVEERDADEAELQALDYSLGAETDGDPQGSFHAQHAEDSAAQDLLNSGESHNDIEDADPEEFDDNEAEDTGNGEYGEAGDEEFDQMSPDLQNEDASYDMDVPYIVARFGGQDYSLFRTPDVDMEFLLDDPKVFRSNISEFLASLRKALQADLNEGDELVILVEDLCLEIQPIIVSAMKSVSISDFVNLHAKLVSNDQDDEEEESIPLRLTILARPTFTSRYQELLDGVSQGMGLSQLRRDFDIGRGDDEEYRSPFRNEEGLEEHDDEMDYEQLAPVGEEESHETSPDGEDEEYQFPYEQHPDQEVDGSYSGADQHGHYGDDETNGADYEQDDSYYDENGEYVDEEYPDELVQEEPQQQLGDAFHEDEVAIAQEQEPENRVALHDEAAHHGDSMPAVIAGAKIAQEDDIIDYSDDELVRSKAQQQQANIQSEQPDATALGEDTSASATMDGDDDHDLGEIDYDLGFTDNGEAEADEAGGVSLRPETDEITWEEDDEGGVALLPTSLEPSASSVHGKRPRSGEEDESVEGSGAIDNKRRRSS